MDKSGKPEDMWFKSIPPAQRLSRQEMIAVADGYFTGLQKNDGKGIGSTGTYPFTNDCHRIENGSPTTNVPRPANEKPGTINLFSLDCLTQFKMGLYYVVQNIHSRRYPLVDQERGVVWAHCVFDQGTVNSGVLSDGTKHSYNGFNRPSSILVTEAFLIENGKIRRVEMIGPGRHLSPAAGLARRAERQLRRPGRVSLAAVLLAVACGRETAPPSPAAAEFELSEASVSQLQDWMATGRYTARRLVELYLRQDRRDRRRRARACARSSRLIPTRSPSPTPSMWSGKPKARAARCTAFRSSSRTTSTPATGC